MITWLLFVSGCISQSAEKIQPLAKQGVMDLRGWDFGKKGIVVLNEKWDGSGYPEGLKEETIPLSARITAVADVYDALTSERSYEKAFSHKKAIEMIISDSGKHFDPNIIEAFCVQLDQFGKIRKSILE